MAIKNAYISCRYGDMTISRVNSTNILTIYPLTKPSLDHEKSLRFEDIDEESSRPLLTLDMASNFKENTEDDLIRSFIAHPHINFNSPLSQDFGKQSRETCSPVELAQ